MCALRATGAVVWERVLLSPFALLTCARARRAAPVALLHFVRLLGGLRGASACTF